jgi:hypothetical protein
LKTILNTAINLQNDFKLLQEHLQSIDLTIQDFEQATGNTDGGKSANIYKQLQQRFDSLSMNYFDFLKRCKQISDQCERYMITYNEVKNLNEQIVKSMNEFNQNLISDDTKQQVTLSSLTFLFCNRNFFRMIINYNFFFLMFNNN